MTSWVTYARPFAKRIAAYREITEQKITQGDFNYPGDDYIVCVQYTWAEFRDTVFKETT